MNNPELQVTNYLFAKAAKNFTPLDGVFELTPVCNMNCRMCYVRKSKEEQEKEGNLISASKWLEIGKSAVDRGTLYILLTGGEPFLRTDLREILEGLKQMGLIIAINTNGTLINEETVSWLKNCRPNKVNITLYGASNETYGRLCRNPHGFDQVTKAIDLLLEAGINLKLNCSLTPDNFADLKDMVKFAADRNLILNLSTYMFPAMRKDGLNIGFNRRFDPQKSVDVLHDHNVRQEGKEKVLQRYKEHLQEVEALAEERKAGTQKTNRGLDCKAGTTNYWITWKGDFYACGMIPEEGAPNVLEQGFDNCWKQTVERIHKVELPLECAICDYRKVCRPCAACVMTETGGFEKVPKYKCEATKYRVQLMKDFVQAYESEKEGNNENQI